MAAEWVGGRKYQRRGVLIEASALVSEDKKYRYILERRWDPSLPRMVLIGLNPSVADGFIDDRTVRRCLDFARREKCGALLMLNLFAFRSTDPRVLRLQDDPVGPENDENLRLHATRPELFVAAWGAPAAWARPRIKAVEAIFKAQGRRLYCFGTTLEGYPRHPLYLGSSTPLEKFRS